MSTGEKVGLGVLVGLFVLFGVILWATVERPAHTVSDPSESVIIQQRIINLEKSNP